MKSVYLRNEEDKRRGVEYVMNKILGFYKECLELRPEYLIGVADERGVTILQEVTNKIACRKFFKKNECEVFTEAGDGVRIIPNGIRSFFKEMDQDSAHMVAAFKVPKLKPGEYEICMMRIEQYIQIIDYALWEVIENGATLPKTIIVEGVVTVMPITTAEEKGQRRL
ncbi:hypothetical protein Tco_0461728 [Tanacetum coccineum]